MWSVKTRKFIVRGGNKLIIYGNTDIGNIRSVNQDTLAYEVINEELAFAIVCDGMGGHHGGEIASQITCDTIFKTLHEKLINCKNEEEYKSLIINAISNANITVYEKAVEEEEYIGMGTTVVVLVYTLDKVYIAHVGDSRAYMFNSGVLYQITKDHSLVQTLLEKGEITQEEMEIHPRKNLITRAVGVDCIVDIDITELSLTKSEKISFLLCSDGLTNECSNKTIKQILTDARSELVVDTLIDLAKRMGGHDNVTVVYVV